MYKHAPAWDVEDNDADLFSELMSSTVNMYFVLYEGTIYYVYIVHISLIYPTTMCD